ncbi:MULTISPECIES: helix-turn-helix domain-containing protein [Catenuloplanes]|uniref:helix-turn-helix domain-containing protein n=1 Tax=Catenuloplanes TaxID=33874 RepID=UPI0035B565DE
MSDPARRAPRSAGSAPHDDEGSLPPVLSARQTADYLGVDVAEVIAGLQEGELPGNRLGARWLIRKIALDAWLDSGSRRVAEPTGR